jgi:hypothetical protein
MASGWIYCMTCPSLACDDTYKLGYTAKVATTEEVQSSLISRYGTYWIDPMCMALFPVRQPNKAEQYLFSLLEDFQVQKEHYKADYGTIIKPALDNVAATFSPDSAPAVVRMTELDIAQYKMLMSHKCNSFFRYNDSMRYAVSTFLMNNYLSMNLSASNVGNMFNIYNALQNAGLMTMSSVQMHCWMTNWDWSDPNLKTLLAAFKVL